MTDSNYIVTVSNSKKNTIEFELEAEGVKVNKAAVNLVIESATMGLMFEASKKSGKKWEVEIPPLPMLKETTYPFKVTLATEGYYFEPMTGKINIVGNESVKVTAIPSARVGKKKVTESTILEPKKVKSKSGAKPLFENKKPVKTETKKTLNESEISQNKDQVISNILDEVGIPRKKRLKSILNY
jgi:hypothetical protein